MKIPSYASNILRVVISVSLIGILLYTQNIEELKSSLSSFNLVYLPLSLMFIIIGTYASSLRWQAILKASDVEIPSKNLFSYYLKGYFYNNFLPTQMGGDVYKAAAVGSQLKDQSVGFFSVFMDRFSGLLILLTLALFGISYYFGVKAVLIILPFFILGLFLYFPILKIVSKKIKFFKKFYEASLVLVKDKKIGLTVLGLSMLVQVFSYLMTYMVFLGFGIHLTIKDVLLTMPVSSLSLLIPSINGLGAQDFAYANIFKLAAVSPTVSFSASIVVHIIRLILSLIGGSFILFNFGVGTNK